MMMRRYIATLLVACTMLMCFGQGEVHWLEMEHDFGTIHEEDGKVSCSMRLVNTGDSALLITHVRTSCGCTASDYDKSPIAPGDTSSIRITYDPTARPGEFVKNVFVYTDGNPRRSSLEIRGKVIAQPTTLSEFYPVTVGALRMTNASIPLGELTRDRKRSSYLTVLNSSTTDTLLVSVLGSKPHIKAAATPDTLPPGAVGAVTVFFDSSKAPLWGLNTDTLTVMSEALRPSATALAGMTHIQVMAQVLDDFSKLSEKARQQAPVIEVSTDKLMFTAQEPTATFTITNTGRQPLELRRIWTAEPGIAIVCDHTKVKSGKQATVTVTIDPNALGKTLLNSRLTIVSNAPQQQSCHVRLVGEL